MYPRLLEIPLPFELFGSEVLTIYSFGAMMAIAFLVAAWVARKELDRLYSIGRLKAVRVPVPANKGAKTASRKRGAKAKMMEVSPGYLIGTVVVLAVVGGIGGAKLFYIFDHMEDFARDPMGLIFSRGGLAFYGGLLVAAGSISWYVKSKGVPLAIFAEVILPTVLLAYGIGRIGCHLAGDGDWGIAANAVARPGFIPTFLWGETYPNNILGMELPATGVYPTPLYEFLIATLLFGVLRLLRDHPFRAGWLAWVTVLFVAGERYLIEQIRVNNEYGILGLMATQAEVISVILAVAAVAGLVITSNRRIQTDPTESS